MLKCIYNLIRRDIRNTRVELNYTPISRVTVELKSIPLADKKLSLIVSENRL